MPNTRLAALYLCSDLLYEWLGSEVLLYILQHCLDDSHRTHHLTLLAVFPLCVLETHFISSGSSYSGLIFE